MTKKVFAVVLLALPHYGYYIRIYGTDALCNIATRRVGRTRGHRHRQDDEKKSCYPHILFILFLVQYYNRKLQWNVIDFVLHKWVGRKLREKNTPKIENSRKLKIVTQNNINMFHTFSVYTESSIAYMNVWLVTKATVDPLHLPKKTFISINSHWICMMHGGWNQNVDFEIWNIENCPKFIYLSVSVMLLEQWPSLIHFTSNHFIMEIERDENIL